MPQPGSGSCNRYLLGAANVGIFCGLTDPEIANIILRNLSRPGPGTKQAIDRAISRARSDFSAKTYVYTSQSKPIAASKKTSSYFARWLSRHPVSIDEAVKNSPIKLTTRPIDDAKILLDLLYSPGDLLFIGEHCSTTIHSVESWKNNPMRWGSFVIPNPLDGHTHRTKSATKSLRCDAAVPLWKFAVAEFDRYTIEEQIAIWLNIDLPVAALIYSGNKSIHAWILVEAKPNDYADVRNLYACLDGIGIDPSLKHPSALSRMPGMYRLETKSYQRVIWLANIDEVRNRYGPENHNSSGGGTAKG